MRPSGLRSFLVLNILFGLFVACSGCGNDDGAETIDVQIFAGGETSLIKAELADSDEERAQGLMNRTSLDEDAGMLFVWTSDVQNAFWMKDTPISLDIIFVSDEKLINGIAKATTPYSTDLIVPESAYRYVLELGAGFADGHGLGVGDRLSFDEN